jgi:hypothetical protein
VKWKGIVYLMICWTAGWKLLLGNKLIQLARGVKMHFGKFQEYSDVVV